MRARIALAAALCFGCDDGGSAPDASAPDAAAIDDGASMGDAGAGGPCQAFEGPTELGRIDDPGLTELSGLAASRRHPGLFYAHNDSGDVARVYVLDASASVVGRIALTGAAHVDYEDIAVGPGPDGEPWVHVGDVGDNAARDGRGTPRDAIAVYRFREPDDPPRGDLEVGVDTLTLRYPETAHDCEALAVEADGSLLLLTKEDVGPSVLFRASPSSPDLLEALTTLNVGGPDVPGSRNVTAMDLSPGGALLVRSYNRVHLFPREEGEPWADALGRPPVPVPARMERQGEAIAWRADGRAYVTASEGEGAPVYLYEATTPGCVAP